MAATTPFDDFTTGWSDMHPCGHRRVTAGCGGCDPGAIEFVIDDESPRVLRAPRPDDFTDAR